MHRFSKDTVSYKQKCFSKDALRSLLSRDFFLSSVVSDTFFPALLAAANVFRITGEVNKEIHSY